MNFYNRILFVGFLLLGLFNSGFGNLVADDSNAALDDESDYVEYDDENTSKNVESNSVNNIAVVNTKAYFDVKDTEQKVKVGETATLECDVKNVSAINIIFWYNHTTLLFQKQIRVLADARTNLSDHKHSLIINNVQATDEGVYRCSVVPENIELKTKLIVLTKPIARIYNGKEDVSDISITYSQGDTISVQCVGVGNPTPTIKWFTDGIVVEKVPGVHVKNNSLIINRADYHHVHVYQCLAENSVGLFHVTVTINIKHSPKITTHNRFVNTKDGVDAELHCNYKSTTPAHVSWVKGKTPIDLTNTTKYEFYNEVKKDHNTTILIVKQIVKQDLGNYECVVQNSIGKNHLKIKLLYEPEPPKFVTVEINDNKVTSYWHIRSMLPLTEIILNYQENGSTHWIKEAPTIPKNSKEHTGLWEIKHLLTVGPGIWHTRVKASNTVGWSEYSDEHSFNVPSKYDNEFEYHNPRDMTEMKKEKSQGNSSATFHLTSAIFLSSILLSLFRI